jgi:DNA-binding response OmpR family regulator
MGTGRSICILIVDDHGDSVVVMERLLRRNGHTVYTARSLEQGRKMAADHRCDLLISDIDLPDGSGLELLKHLRAAYPLKSIAISSHAEREHADAALAAGFDMYLNKPITFTALLAAIDTLVV